MERKSKLWKSNGNKFEWGKDTITSSNFADALLSMKYENITYDFIMDRFASFKDNQFSHTYDLIEIPIGSFSYINLKGKSISNKKPFITTLGLWIYNIILRDLDLTKVVGYINQSINKKMYGKIEQQLSYALIEDKITVDSLRKYEDTMQWIMPFEDVLAPNHTEKMITCTKIINKRKEELIKKHKDEIEKGNIVIAKEIEDELLALAKEYLGDDPCIDTILSGAGGNFENNFKNMYVMKGAIRNPDPNAKQQYNIVTSNYIDGVKADEYPIIAGAGAAGAYSRGKKTETGGYWEKLFVSAYQYLQLDPPGSDCGTDKYITVHLTKNNISDYMYCYTTNGKLITSDNANEFIDKIVHLRFASMCKSKTGICNKCAGEMFYSLDMKNIGMMMSQIPSTLKNKCMKSFHDSTVQVTTIDPMKAFFPFDEE